MWREYGNRVPLRLNDEVHFWKVQEREHTVVIRQLAQLEPEWVGRLQNWEADFHKLEERAVRLGEHGVRTGRVMDPRGAWDVYRMAEEAYEQSRRFINFLRQLESRSQGARDPVVKVVLAHIRRESEYFLGTVEALWAGA